MKKDDKCCIKHCRDDIAIYYYGKGLCNKHWTKLSEKPVAYLKKLLNIKDGEL